MPKNYIFTSESVTEGHPDKMADQISDSILDEMLRQDPQSRVACETLVTTGLVIVAGEVTTNAYADIPKIVRHRINDIGYNHSDMGFDANSCSVLVSLDEQSQDIAQGVNYGEGAHTEQGAGDQGLMFGYAVNESDNYMPLTIDLAHKLAHRLTDVRKQQILPFLRPDGKTQISAQYIDGKIERVQSIVVSSQHDESVSSSTLEEAVREEVINKIVPAKLVDNKTNIYVNPTGRFVKGGPVADCGLTGRKIIVDTYGGHGAHGGGAFSGKDPTKVDRSAAYAARQVAKHIVAAGWADKALVQVAYAIGVADPVSFFVNCFGTEKVKLPKINKAINEVFDMKPKSMIERLDLLRPIYAKTAAYGHFGRIHEAGFTWEKLDHLDELKALI